MGQPASLQAVPARRMVNLGVVLRGPMDVGLFYGLGDSWSAMTEKDKADLTALAYAYGVPKDYKPILTGTWGQAKVGDFIMDKTADIVLMYEVLDTMSDPMLLKAQIVRSNDPAWPVGMASSEIKSADFSTFSRVLMSGPKPKTFSDVPLWVWIGGGLAVTGGLVGLGMHLSR